MQDTIIKGTGNSRTLRSVSDFLTQYPNYNSFVAALIAGTLPIDLGGLVSDGCTQVGTPLNTENLTAFVGEQIQPLADTVETLGLQAERAANKVTEITAESTDTEYPSASAVWAMKTQLPVQNGDAVASVVEGMFNTASGVASHAEGSTNTATSDSAHAEGSNNNATGISSHAEGDTNEASGNESHAENYANTASGDCSHAEGRQNVASGKGAHVEGWGNLASGQEQHVGGRFNVEDTEDTYAEIIGNGDDNGWPQNPVIRSNARTLDWSGNEWLAGKLTMAAPGTGDNDAVTHGQMSTAIAASSSVFVATYGVTTSAEIEAAYQAGKAVYAKKGEWIQPLSYIAFGNSYAEFYGISGSATFGFSCGNGTWNQTRAYYLAPEASPAFTGTPTAPTAASGTNTTQIATTAFVQAAIGTAIGGSY